MQRSDDSIEIWALLCVALVIEADVADAWDVHVQAGPESRQETAPRGRRKHGEFTVRQVDEFSHPGIITARVPACVVLLLRSATASYAVRVHGESVERAWLGGSTSAVVGWSLTPRRSTRLVWILPASLNVTVSGAAPETLHEGCGGMGCQQKSRDLWATLRSRCSRWSALRLQTRLAFWSRPRMRRAVASRARVR